MDEEQLLEALLTRYAAMAEDAADLAATKLPTNEKERLKVIATLNRSATDMLSLAEAAQVVSRR